MWPHLVCISSPLLDKRTNKRAFAFLRSSAVRPGHHNRTHPEKTPTVCRGGVGVCGATGGERREKKNPTLVHKAAILNSLTGLYQEANKRDSKCDTVHFVCASANSGAMCPIKQRSPTLRSYLIRHQSFPLLPTRIQVNYLHLGRICSSARKWLFSAPSEDCPFWIT